MKYAFLLITKSFYKRLGSNKLGTLLPTAYVVRGKVMFLHASVCLSTPRGWVPWPGPGRGVPQPGPAGGYPSQVQGYPDGGYPTSGTPRQTWLGGTPPHVPPCQTWLGVPWWGVPHLGYPPVRPGWGVPWRGVGVPHRVVLDTPRSVCLLRLRRRTFLFFDIESQTWKDLFSFFSRYVPVIFKIS